MEFEVMRKRIRELRETAGLSQNRLGKLAGIQQASINRYEHGQAVPSPKALLWYANTSIFRWITYLAEQIALTVFGIRTNEIINPLMRKHRKSLTCVLAKTLPSAKS